MVVASRARVADTQPGLLGVAWKGEVSRHCISYR
jgi:hypothetical protein